MSGFSIRLNNQKTGQKRKKEEGRKEERKCSELRPSFAGLKAVLSGT